jgi:lipopolysaccharide transport system permease protein
MKVLAKDALSTGTPSRELDGSPICMVRRTTGWRFLDLRELWAHRELLYFLTSRDIKVRYKQTAIGVAWVVLQPLVMMIVFTVLFGRLTKVPSGTVPYPLFAYAGLLPWQVFAKIVSSSANSLISDQRLISRVYFPRIIVPIATTMAATVDLIVGVGLLFPLMIYYRVSPSLAIVWLPVFILLMLITALGIGFWLSALNVEYRDVTAVIPFLIQVWFFATPVIYPSLLIPPQWRIIYGLNPMAGVVEGFRWALLGARYDPHGMLAVSALIALTVFVSGIVWFRSRERTFVETLG